VGVVNRLLCCIQNSVMKIWPQRPTKRFHPRITEILVLLARAFLEGTHLFQTGTRTDVVRMLRDKLAQDFDCG
jgi:hypothetical protein